MTLLSDEQVRQFICDGYLQLASELDESIHQRIDQRLRFAYEKEFIMGNNIMARVPELHDVVEDPVIDGAIQSLLGPGYLLHPHRAVHTSTPVEKPDELLQPEDHSPTMGKGSLAGSGWHQDAHSPLARARHHVPRHIILFYFPHDTPIEMGPTRFQAGSHLAQYPGTPKSVVFPEFVTAGSIYLLHFDMVHAGTPNYGELTRYMVKFICSRTRHPKDPSWNNLCEDWRNPVTQMNPAHLPNTNAYIWQWMRGKPTSQRPLSDLVEQQDDVTQRLEAIYSSRDVGSLVAALKRRAGLGLHERKLVTDEDGKTIPRDLVNPRSELQLDSTGLRWNERAIVMENETYALASLEESIPSLHELLRHEDPWVLINACFAIGEFGPRASSAVPQLTGLIEHPLQQVVRQALDALSCIGEGINSALPGIERLITESNSDWQEAQVTRGWTAEDGVRVSAITALLNAVEYESNDLSAVELICRQALQDSNGYVCALAIETLTRIGSPSAMQAAVRYLKRQRWDDSLSGMKIY